MPPAMPSVVKKILLSVAATAISLLICEGVVRAFGLAPSFGATRVGQHSPSSDPELIWVNTVGALDHNDLGLRGPHPDPTHGHHRILLLGDSIAYGHGLSYEESIAYQLEDNLARGQRPAEVLIGAVCGYNTLQEARWLEEYADRLAPDEIVLLYCLNDPIPNFSIDERIARDSLREGTKKEWLRARAMRTMSSERRWLLSRSHLFRMSLYFTEEGEMRVQRADEQNNGDLLLGKDMTLVRDGLDRIVAVASRLGVPLRLVVVPWIRSASAEPYGPQTHHNRVANLAQERGIAVLDLLGLVSNAQRRTGKSLHLPDDPVHPDRDGARLIARGIAEFLIAHAEDAAPPHAVGGK